MRYALIAYGYAFLLTLSIGTYLLAMNVRSLRTADSPNLNLFQLITINWGSEYDELLSTIASGLALDSRGMKLAKP